MRSALWSWPGRRGCGSGTLSRWLDEVRTLPLVGPQTDTQFLVASNLRCRARMSGAHHAPPYRCERRRWHGGVPRGWSAIDNGHVPFVVALACGRRQVVQPLDLLGAQVQAVGCGVLLDAGDPLGAGNRGDVIALRKQPRQGDLRRCRTHLCGNGLDLVNDAQVAPEILAGEARVGLAPIVVGELFGRANLAGEEAVAQRRVGNEADAQLA